MIKMIKIEKISVKMKFLIRKQQRDPRTDRVTTLDACFNKDVGFVWFLDPNPKERN